MIKQIGVIADTHGLLRPEAKAALKKSDVIFHAGDIGRPEIILELRKIAPVYAVRGNTDREEWADQYPKTSVVRFGGHNFYILHDLKSLDFDPDSAGISVVVSGHSHQANIREQNNVLYINPGGAGPKRFKFPIGIGRLTISGRKIEADIIQLPV